MTDYFSIISLPKLLKVILNQIDKSDFVLGISKDLFFTPNINDSFRTSRFGQLLESPIGVAAGPQTQLAQNIVAAWLTGARFIELKTVQTLDELNVSKPCIDMQDEGYNCEWSQELKIEQSFDQYLNAWIIIHILRDKFGWDKSADPGVIFNMSVGYNYDGIINSNVQWFFEKMDNARAEMKIKIESIKSIYPNIENLEINPTLSNNVTLSTMHGCPSDEIEKIGEYLIVEKKLHTTIKLNPTLLGKEKLHEILDSSGFDTIVPDRAFEHDLNYDEALKIIGNLQKKADYQNLHFGIKLTNTLESLNNKDVFPKDEKMMYMSGRALHPISINLAYKLQNDCNGKLDISFSGGADAFNIAEIVSCGLTPVTVCTDLLKPGGYARLNQYIGLLKNSVVDKNNFSNLKNLKNYLKKLSENKAYKKVKFHDQSIKTNRQLKQFDCTHAPCVDTCPTNQGIPDYMYCTSKGEFEKADEVIKQTNPFPHTTGMICDHICQSKCTRINYDSPILIREIKRTVAENSHREFDSKIANTHSSHPKKVAIIGAGPSGLSCAYFLALAGMKVIVYESKDKPGGMVSGAIPSFRLTNEAIDFDIKKIEEAGVVIKYNYAIDKAKFAKLRCDNDYVYIGTGAQVSRKLFIDGIEVKGVIDPLDFLFKVKNGDSPGIGHNVVIIGGGNTAMDAARTAYRCVGENGKVTVVYRRTIKEMPADKGEIQAVIDEGIEMLELTAPVSIVSDNGKIISILYRKMMLGEKDESGRARPIEISGSDFEIFSDTVIPAIGQELNIDFIENSLLATNIDSYQTQIENVFIGGDAMHGASTAIIAIGDGRKAAQEIIDNANIGFSTNPVRMHKPMNYTQLMNNKAVRIMPQNVLETSLDDRKNFNLVSTTLSKEEAIKEASRCLLCDEVCDICTTVCPNMAFHSFEITPVKYNAQKINVVVGKVEISEGSLFEIKQKHQILHIVEWCNQCGNCTTFCPTSGSPYIEKPHLYLIKKEFEKNRDGYFLDVENEYPQLFHYHNDKPYVIHISDEKLFYSSSYFTIKLNYNTLKYIDIEVDENTNFELDMAIIAQLKIILQGALSFYGI
ncbi:MAG: putative selenate reductase subunit YgfK [Bacteroidetes bacterium]|nr:putative selenate reductase subunit YgfK [Bacteroidota bacterium]